eukprot:5057415-Alexandrium_andersonii.AAC.1
MAVAAIATIAEVGVASGFSVAVAVTTGVDACTAVPVVAVVAVAIAAPPVAGLAPAVVEVTVARSAVLPPR